MFRRRVSERLEWVSWWTRSPYCRLNHESTDEYRGTEEVPFAASRNKVRHILPPVATTSLFRDDSIRRKGIHRSWMSITMDRIIKCFFFSLFFCNIRSWMRYTLTTYNWRYFHFREILSTINVQTLYWGILQTVTLSFAYFFLLLSSLPRISRIDPEHSSWLTARIVRLLNFNLKRLTCAKD